MNNKKLLKIIAGVVAIGLIIVILLLATSLLGNPISKALVAHTAKTHIAETYPDLELELSDPSFNFKTGGYHVTAESKTSIDTHFNLAFNAWGKLQNDRYEYSVLGLDNTLRRVDEIYRNQVDAVIDTDIFPYPGYIKFGELHEVPAAELELDKEYDLADMKRLGKADGHLVVYIEDEAVTAERAAEILLYIKKALDNANVGFASINFELIKPRIDDQPSPDDTRFGVANFAYADIYEDGMAERLTAAADELTAYYAEQDALKDAEIPLAK